MLVRICDITATVRHFELPETCPSCREKIIEVNETNLSDVFIDGKLTAEDQDDVADFEPDPKAGWDNGETFIVTGYRCGRCQHVLIQGEFHDEEGD